MSENNNLYEVNVNSVEIPEGNYMIEDEPIKETHPWHRFFARGFDMLIFSTLIPLSMLPLLIYAANMGIEVNFLILGFISLFIYVFIEAGIIAFCGTTIGKWAFGIKVLTQEGKKLTYMEGLKRSFGVWIKGLGLGIPLISFFTQIAAHGTLTENGITSWDQKGGFVVHHKGISKPRAVFLIVFYFVLYFGLQFSEFFI